MANHHELANFIWQIADLLRGPYRPPQYERVMLPMTVLRRFDCVLAPTKVKVLAEYERRKGGKLEGDALDTNLNKAAGQRFLASARSLPSSLREVESAGSFAMHLAIASLVGWVISGKTTLGGVNGV